MASNYNSRGLPAEKLVHRKEYALIHKEEHISEIISLWQAFGFKIINVWGIVI